jgi:hypothetical protein
MFQCNLNQSSKYFAYSCFNVENIKGLSTFEFDTDVTVTTPVHSFDTCDRENTSAVTDTSANFNAAVTDSIRNLCSIARADVPTTDDIAINDWVDPL